MIIKIKLLNQKFIYIFQINIYSSQFFFIGILLSMNGTGWLHKKNV